ncbi:1-acyl-sn-glycerol-3-phosphate acyltransferase [Hasllibacter sp. MH4015]|uniref:1-acyl-sn-glycerol-3-phosphate acyltransferase n=1 Tax=Hasllibacter sp. MH4015 TaxID=2854029 RepID=UPI001CD2F0D2|nr:1-acyl-sn-glycerol-3-phosphate acyltransferase [Hasllibacter sp. MH4015]
MNAILRLLDATLGRILRHVFFICLRTYFSLFYNISCSNKHLLQPLPRGLILATHVTRLDGPMVASLLYPARRVLPAVHYNEYYHPAQFPILMPSGCIPLSSPKSWPAEKRAERKAWAQDKLNKTIRQGKIVLLFPGGQAKRQEREVIQPHFSGAYDTLKANPDCPVLILRIRGLSKYDIPVHDRFWSFLGIMRGRRHVGISIERLEDGLDTSVGLERFNRELEERFNAPPHWPAAHPAEGVS